jgi:hypothetical protein
MGKNFTSGHIMKIKKLLGKVILIFILALFTNVFAETPEEENKPEAYFPENTFTFGNIVEGTLVVHNFVIENKGDAPLAIQRVKSTWGCAAVSFTRLIPPGSEGKITIEVNTAGYGGRALKKSATVITNDPDTPEFELIIQGDVDSFATITPPYLRLVGNAEEKISSKVIIVPSEKYPFEILEVKALNGENIEFYLEKNQKGDKPGYTLTVENLLKQQGRYYDTVQLKTDSKIKPFLTVKVYGNIFEKPDERKTTKQIQNN